MRLLWVTENYPPSPGGMANSCDRIVRGLRRAGVVVDVVHLSRRAGAGRITPEQGGRLITVPLGEDAEHALRMLWTSLEAAAYTHVVAFGGTYPLLAAPVYAAWSGKPLITLLRGNDFDTGMFSLRRQPVVREALRSSAHVCVVASSTAPLVSALAPGVPVTWVANGIDADEWQVLPSESRKAAAWRAEHVTDGRRTIGLIGQLKNKKGVRLLLDALAPGRHDFHLILAGDLEPGMPLDGHPHTILPFQDRYQLLTVYASCDVIALPSFYDGLPNVALEAAALGIPLLASDAGGLADLVDETIGFRFRAGDPHGCRSALHRAAEATDEQLGALGEAAARRVRERFGIARETDGYLKVLAATR
ncbi:Glycogen synthase [Actinoplanes sp. SE50]|uniref:glycosyltransferase family 4 protein n=1 Tax=unclassified Actinoplanes TaxID=2626549 RepID=UPI00023EC450|nr:MULTISPECIES: glycosyltransferase family 4 protein [unclassified Actinoplanes]AEV84126.1 Glycogen synthase [Actinoplanes sp. SE50/110]ATO82518.1 Glycogen synthase [Actinoplanes sp. SE50]SLL99925.1 glycogen synthase [Actinoplanes sp. SE50/110]